MRIEGTTALVTGANRGCGRAYVQALLDAGAAKVYACARRPESVPFDDARVVALKLDLTFEDDIQAGAARADDVALVIHNAGHCAYRALMSSPDLDGAGLEMTTNLWGPLALTRALRPALQAQGGGCVVTMLSVVAFANMPVIGSLSVTKAALHNATQGLRAEMAQIGTQVVGVYPSMVDTDMMAGVDGPKLAPDALAREVVDGVAAGEREVFPGEQAKRIRDNLARDPKAVERRFAAYTPKARVRVAAEST
ncbi:MAG: SDR family NAD(P)-dependent oxidoreductase [Alphaproteobacteria bacterium]